MSQAAGKDDDLMKKTLVTVAAMLAAVTLFVGTLSLLVAFVVGRAVSDGSAPVVSEPTVVDPAAATHGPPRKVGAHPRATESL